jgi:nucleotide-binding universal stress UspA family protein
MQAPYLQEVDVHGRILCAVDRSIEARGAADVAATLAARLGAPLVLAHVLPDWPMLPPTAEAEFARHRGGTLESAQDLLERIASDSGTEPRLRLAFGDPSEAILTLADEERAQLLVVGSRGRSGLKASILGSVSGFLAARSPRPVVVVPPGGADGFRLSLSERAPSVVCGVDGSDGAELAVRQAVDMAARLGIRLVLVHVYGALPRGARPTTSGALPHHGAVALEAERSFGREALERAAAVAHSKVDVSLKLESGDVASTLARRAARECAAVIVTGSRGRGVLTSALLGSVSKQLAASSGRPVMVVPADPLEPNGRRFEAARSEGPAAA